MVSRSRTTASTWWDVARGAPDRKLRAIVRADGGARVETVELRRVRQPLASPWRTAAGVVEARDVLLVKVVTDVGEGWGECVAGSEPNYTEEYVDGAHDMIRRFLGPLLLGADRVHEASFAAAAGSLVGHSMAKAAIEQALLDALLTHRGMSLAQYLGATRRRVPAGVAVGIVEPVELLVEQVAELVAAGYQRVKLKVRPGADVEPVSAVSASVGESVALQVDANGSYAGAETSSLLTLDRLGLAMIEQPLEADDFLGHARLADRLETPVCLDESIRNLANLELALDVGACSIVNLKPGRVGGLLEARRLHDAGVAAGVALWCGGMLETGIGRAASIALAALPGFTLPGDLSESRRYWERDLTAPFELKDGCLEVPTEPGNGVVVDEDYVEAITTHQETLRRHD